MKREILDNYYLGHCCNAYQVFGSHLCFEKEKGVRFSVHAPNAKSVRVVGDFNNWDCNANFLEKIDEQTFSTFIGKLKKGTLYKYIIETSEGELLEKADPFAFSSELRPNQASVVTNIDFKGRWHDQKWMKSRSKNFDLPLNIYELHLSSWMKKAEDEYYTYDEIALKLAKYLKKHYFTHVELMPICEHPFDGSWGYQTSGYYSVTSRYGSNEQFQKFVDILHQNGIGVILDFVPVHFVADSFALAKFDGTPLYEYTYDHDSRSEWGTYNFDLWKENVRSFLMSAANFYLDVYHVDGIRMDAIKNAIYWQGDRNRGVNEGALAFLKRMNYNLHTLHPQVMLIAEDSSDYPGICCPTLHGGLGFDYKWGLGWMNDTLKYMKNNPLYRGQLHHNLTFTMAYFFSERFILPFSHDEVVHGKCSIIDKMWGEYHQKFDQVKALYVYQYMHPGKKLNFMGNEIAHFREFDDQKEMDWFLLDYPIHQDFVRFFDDLLNLYSRKQALWLDYEDNNFEWIDADNKPQNLYSFMRKSETSTIVVVINFSGCHYKDQQIGVRYEGSYRELLRSDHVNYGGLYDKKYTFRKTSANSCNGYDQSLVLDIAPFSAIVLEKIHRKKKEKVNAR